MQLTWYCVMRTLLTEFRGTLYPRMNVAGHEGAQLLGFDQCTGEYEVAYRQVGLTLTLQNSGSSLWVSVAQIGL